MPFIYRNLYFLSVLIFFYFIIIFCQVYIGFVFFFPRRPSQSLQSSSSFSFRSTPTLNGTMDRNLYFLLFYHYHFFCQVYIGFVCFILDVLPSHCNHHRVLASDQLPRRAQARLRSEGPMEFYHPGKHGSSHLLASLPSALFLIAFVPLLSLSLRFILISSLFLFS